MFRLFYQYLWNLTKDAKEEVLWPLLLFITASLYLLFHREVWPSLTFILLSFVCVVFTVSRLLEYFYIQKRFITLIFVIISFLLAVALGISALIAAPTPIMDFSKLRGASRWVWAAALPFIEVVAYLDLGFVLRRIKQVKEIREKIERLEKLP